MPLSNSSLKDCKVLSNSSLDGGLLSIPSPCRVALSLQFNASSASSQIQGNASGRSLKILNSSYDNYQLYVVTRIMNLGDEVRVALGS